VPSGLTATPIGLLPTGIVAVTVFVAVSITETVFSYSFVIYAYGPPPIRIGTSAMSDFGSADQNKRCYVFEDSVSSAITAYFCLSNRVIFGISPDFSYFKNSIRSF